MLAADAQTLPWEPLGAALWLCCPVAVLVCFCFHSLSNRTGQRAKRLFFRVSRNPCSTLLVLGGETPGYSAGVGGTGCVPRRRVALRGGGGRSAGGGERTWMLLNSSPFGDLQLPLSLTLGGCHTLFFLVIQN